MKDYFKIDPEFPEFDQLMLDQQNKMLADIKNQRKIRFEQNSMNALPGAMAFMGQAFNAAKYGQTADDILRDAGTTMQSVGGVGYQTYKNIDTQRLMDENHKQHVSNTLGLMATGATTGAAFGPIGAAIGGGVGLLAGLFGGGKSHAQAREAQQDAIYRANMTNNYNRSVAATQAAQMENRRMYGNYENMPLHAAGGLEGKYKRPGLEMAYTSANETVDNRDYPELSGRVPGTGKEGDWIPTYVQGDGNVFTNQDGVDGVSFADLAIGPVTVLKNIKASVDAVKGKQAKEVTEKVLAKYKNQAEDQLDTLAQAQYDSKVANGMTNEYPHAATGLEWGNLLTSGIGGLIGLGQYFGAKNQRVKNPNTYVPNIYAPRAFDILGGMRISSKPIMDQINRDDAAGRYRLATAGGLSGAQKYLGNIALTNNSQVARANALAAIQQQNNAYGSQYAQALLTSGAQEAQNRMATNQWDLDYYSKAHAARQQGMQMGLYNSLNQLQQYMANANKLKMFGDMKRLYEADIKSRA